MTTNVSQRSAEILQFPVARVRQAADARRELNTAADLTAPLVAGSAFGSWYHEAAIEDAKHTREH